MKTLDIITTCKAWNQQYRNLDETTELGDSIANALRAHYTTDIEDPRAASVDLFQGYDDSHKCTRPVIQMLTFVDNDELAQKVQTIIEEQTKKEQENKMKIGAYVDFMYEWEKRIMGKIVAIDTDTVTLNKYWVGDIVIPVSDVL